MSGGTHILAVTGENGVYGENGGQNEGTEETETNGEDAPVHPPWRCKWVDEPEHFSVRLR